MESKKHPTICSNCFPSGVLSTGTFRGRENVRGRGREGSEEGKRANRPSPKHFEWNQRSCPTIPQIVFLQELTLHKYFF
jgi:hypothetical protein